MNFDRKEIHAILDVILNEMEKAQPDLAIGGGGQTTKSRRGVGLALIIGNDFMLPGEMSCNIVAKLACEFSQRMVSSMTKNSAKELPGYSFDANKLVKELVAKATNADKPSPN